MVYFKYIVIDLVININWKSRLFWNTNDAISSLWYIASGLPFCNTFIKFLISHYLQDLLACFSWLEFLETYFLKIYFIFFIFGMLLLSLVKTLYQNNLECIWDSERPPKPLYLLSTRLSIYNISNRHWICTDIFLLLSPYFCWCPNK